MTRPLYLRLLRVRHLTLRPGTIFVLFEGSIALGILLTLADVVQPWGMVAVPAAVAVMVKLQDVVAGVFVRPLALVQLRTPRPLDGRAVGRSSVLSPSYPTAAIEADDAVADPAATPLGASGDDRGSAEDQADPGAAIAGAPGPGADPSAADPDAADRAGQRRPGVHSPEPPRPDGADGRSRGNQGRFSA